MNTKDRERLDLLWHTLIESGEIVTLVLKAHLFSEFLPDDMLLDHLGAKAPHIEALDLRFNQKLSLARSLGLLPEEGLQALGNLNRVRNNCVHQLNFTPSHEDIWQIVQPLAKDWVTLPQASEPQAILQRFMAFMCGFAVPASELVTEK